MLLFKFKVPKASLFKTEQAVSVLDTERNKFLQNATSTYQAFIKQEAPIGATSLLKNTIGTEVAKTKGLVFTGVKYAIVMEEGRRPNLPAPPIAAMVKWIERAPSGIAWASRIVINRKSKIFSIAKKMKEGGMAGSITNIAKAIILSRSIGKKGIKGKKFFEKGVKNAQPSIDKFLQEYVDALVQGLAK